MVLVARAGLALAWDIGFETIIGPSLKNRVCCWLGNHEQRVVLVFPVIGCSHTICIVSSVHGHCVFSTHINGEPAPLQLQARSSFSKMDIVPPPLPQWFQDLRQNAEVQFFFRKRLTDSDMRAGLSFVQDATYYFGSLPDTYQTMIINHGIQVSCYISEGSSYCVKIKKHSLNSYKLDKPSWNHIVAKLSLHVGASIDCWGLITPHHQLTLFISQSEGNLTYRFRTSINIPGERDAFLFSAK